MTDDKKTMNKDEERLFEEAQKVMADVAKADNDKKAAEDDPYDGAAKIYEELASRGDEDMMEIIFGSKY